MCIFIDSFTNDDVSHSLFDFYWSASSHRTHIYTHTHVSHRTDMYTISIHISGQPSFLFFLYSLSFLRCSFHLIRFDAVYSMAYDENPFNNILFRTFLRKNAIGFCQCISFALLQLVAANCVSRSLHFPSMESRLENQLQWHSKRVTVTQCFYSTANNKHYYCHIYFLIMMIMIFTTSCDAMPLLLLLLLSSSTQPPMSLLTLH